MFTTTLPPGAVLKACEHQEWDTLRVLLQLPMDGGIFNVLLGMQKKDPSTVDKGTGLTALHWLARNARPSEVDLVAPVAALHADLVDHSGAGPLHHLAYNPVTQRDARAAQTLLSEFIRSTEADANDADTTGATPMHVAATHANAKFVMALLWVGGDPNALDVFGQSPEATAEHYGNTDIAVGLSAVRVAEAGLCQVVTDAAERAVQRAATFRGALASHLDAAADGKAALDVVPEAAAALAAAEARAAAVAQAGSLEAAAVAKERETSEQLYANIQSLAHLVSELEEKVSNKLHPVLEFGRRT
jgi:hypothetical protein